MDTRDNKYYEIAKEGSIDKTHPSYYLISKYGATAKKILDLGCGEGTRLNQIHNRNAVKIGVDQSKVAIGIAKKQYPSIKFIKTENNLPFPDNSFDFVYSAFVLEHTNDPENFLKEAVRVLSPGGTLLFVAPNFGAPNRASPNGKYSRIKKMTTGFLNDLVLVLSSKTNRLNWQKVEPQKTYDMIDADTTVEPYLLSLEKYLTGLNIAPTKSLSLWNQEDKINLRQILFRIFGAAKIAPFTYWGPHILFVGEKYKQSLA